MNKEIFKAANFITLCRMFLVLPLVSFTLEKNFLAAGLSYLAFIVSDGLDGYVARKLKQASKFGYYFDGVADAITQLAAFVATYVAGLISGYLFILFLVNGMLKSLRNFYYIYIKGKGYKPNYYRLAILMANLTMLYVLFVPGYNYRVVYGALTYAYVAVALSFVGIGRRLSAA